MDKLRALQYFVAAAEAGTLAGAARRLDVSTPAVHKLLAALERNLGVPLFDRSARGLALTADGERYLESCRPALEVLAAADEQVRPDGARVRGTVVIGAAYQLAQHVIAPALPGWRARYPELHVDLRAVQRVTEPDAEGVDVFALLGWPEHPEFVIRRAANPEVVICAAPAYWAAHGVPRHPAELARHNCLVLRNPVGTVVDLWEFARGTERAAVPVSGWLISNHRDILVDAALAGEGVGRFISMSLGPALDSGLLVPALLDWEIQASAPVSFLYRPNHRRVPRVRLALDFLVQVFRRASDDPAGSLATRLSAERPSWYWRRYGRASAAVRDRG